MRRTILLVATMALTLLAASGVALAVNKIGTNGPDTLRGTKGDDNLYGNGGNDTLRGLAGNDNLLGGAGKDVVFSGHGSDNAVGGDGNDFLDGANGSDKIAGGDGNDFMLDGEAHGGATDLLSGGAGTDVLNPANKPAGKDLVSCGPGVDRVLADRKDVISPDCERVTVGLRNLEAFNESIPESFIEGLPPQL
jgi:hypothetical protein